MFYVQNTNIKHQGSYKALFTHRICPSIPRPSWVWGQLRACLLAHHTVRGAKHVTCSYYHGIYDYSSRGTRMRGQKNDTAQKGARPLLLFYLAGALRGRAPSPCHLGGCRAGAGPAQAAAGGGLCPPSRRGRAGSVPGAVPGRFALTERPLRDQALAYSPPPRRRALQLPACLARRSPCFPWGERRKARREA